MSAGGVTAEVVETLQDRIRDGVYLPGERLPAERALSDELGVSRPTIREAIQALVLLNVLEPRRGSGVYVSELEFDELLRPLGFALELAEPTLTGLFEVRLALEPLASSLAAERRTDDDLVRMRRCLGRANRPVSVPRFVAIDTELHTLIVEAARNELLAKIVASLSFLSYRSRSLTVRQKDMRTISARDHRLIVAAIAAGDADRAETAMRRHLERVWRAARSLQADELSRDRRAAH